MKRVRFTVQCSSSWISWMVSLRMTASRSLLLQTDLIFLTLHFWDQVVLIERSNFPFPTRKREQELCKFTLGRWTSTRMTLILRSLQEVLRNLMEPSSRLFVSRLVWLLSEEVPLNLDMKTLLRESLRCNQRRRHR